MLDSLRRSGAIRLLKSDELRFLNDTRRVQDLLRLRSDAGTSLQAAQAVSGARVLETAALTTIFENFGVARLMTTEGGIAFLTGVTGKPRITSSTTLKLLGAVTSQVSTDAENTRQTTAVILTALGESILPDLSSVRQRRNEQ